MKKILKASLVSGAVVFLWVINAWSLPMVGDTVQMHTNWGDNYGMKILDSSKPMTIDDVYNTFCVEKSETFNNNGIYTVESVGMVATLGGTNYGTSGVDPLTGKLGDPISEESRWLYASFFDGVFDGIASGQTLVNKVQNAIWFSEDEISNSSDYSTLIGLAGGDFTVTGWDIKVVNIVNTGNHRDRQSQLVGTPVPEPAAFVLFGVGLIGLAGFGRKKIIK